VDGSEETRISAPSSPSPRPYIRSRPSLGTARDLQVLLETRGGHSVSEARVVDADVRLEVALKLVGRGCTSRPSPTSGLINATLPGSGVV